MGQLILPGSPVSTVSSHLSLILFLLANLGPLPFPHTLFPHLSNFYLLTHLGSPCSQTALDLRVSL